MRTKLRVGITIIFASYALVGASLCAETEPAGKKIFVDSKCNVCHSINSQSVPKKGPAVKPGDKKAPPDLSMIGDEKTADWIAKFVTKKETLNNKKHPKGWTGKDEDLKVLSEWLASLKKAK